MAWCEPVPRRERCAHEKLWRQAKPDVSPDQGCARIVWPGGGGYARENKLAQAPQLMSIFLTTACTRRP
jgi:hypothetical protein